MKMYNSKKGFTLIELLAVIVILAVIILIASSNIGGMTTTAKKGALLVEGEALVNSAKEAYQLAALDGDVTTGSACFSLEYLYKNGFFTKGSDVSYYGSVLVSPDANATIFTYTFWISNGSYIISNATPGKTKSSAAETNAGAASSNCGGSSAKLFS